MILTDVDIKDRIQLGALDIRPFRPENVQPASIDLTLDWDFRAPRDLTSDVWETQRLIKVEPRDDQTFYVQPDGFYLVSTQERIRLPYNLVGRVEGKSSLARRGLMVHATAGFVDPGFDGQITLELCNVSPNIIIVRPNMLIAQIVFFQCVREADTPYGSKKLNSHYQYQQAPTGAAD